MKKIIISIFMFIIFSFFAFGSLQTGLISHYNMNEVLTDSDLYDSTNNYDLNIIGNVNSTSGFIETSRGSYPIGNYFGDFSYPLNYNTNFTISMWINRIYDGANDNLLWFSKDGTDNLIGFSYNGFLTFSRQKTGIGICGDTAEKSLTLNKNEWYFVTGTNYYNGTHYNISLFLNSVFQANDTSVCDTTALSTNSIAVGTNPLNALIYNAVNFKIDEIALWNRVLTQQEISLLYNSGLGNTYPFSDTIYNATYCTTNNCLFNDDFNTNLSLIDYEEIPYNSSVNGGLLFIDTFNYGSFIAEADFNSVDRYPEIDLYAQYKINYSVVPPELNYTNNTDNTITFDVFLKCSDNTYPVSLNFEIFSSNIYTDNYDYTTFHHYNIKGGYIPLGFYDYENNKRVQIRLRVYKNISKIGVTAQQSENNNNYGIESMSETDDYQYDFNSVCSNFTGVAFGRRDFNYPNTTYLIGIDKILVQGVDTLSPSAKEVLIPEFIYTNQTTQENAVIKTDVSENIMNSLFSFGFKTTASKLILVLIVIVLALFFVFKFDIGNTAKGFLAVIITLFIITTGWYMSLIPTALLVFIIFAVSIIGALIIRSMMSGGN